MNTTEIQKKIAYDLTLEYVRQNNILKQNSNTPISEKVGSIKLKYDEILQAVKDNKFL